MTGQFAAFVQQRRESGERRFRNFASWDRNWLEDKGSEDSHGRTLWALGECARSDENPSRRRWAAGLFAEALPTTELFRSPRTWAFTLLGLDGYCAVNAEDTAARRMRRLFADRLMAILKAVATDDWVWFEEGLSYDNARLPQALIVTGLSLQEPAYVAAGLRSLRWLMTKQTTQAGLFRPRGFRRVSGTSGNHPGRLINSPWKRRRRFPLSGGGSAPDGDAEWKIGLRNGAFA